MALTTHHSFSEKLFDYDHVNWDGMESKEKKYKNVFRVAHAIIMTITLDVAYVAYKKFKGTSAPENTPPIRADISDRNMTVKRDVKVADVQEAPKSQLKTTTEEFKIEEPSRLQVEVNQAEMPDEFQKLITRKFPGLKCERSDDSSTYTYECTYTRKDKASIVQFLGGRIPLTVNQNYDGPATLSFTIKKPRGGQASKLSEPEDKQ
jgi:hypothetical protein